MSPLGSQAMNHNNCEWTNIEKMIDNKGINHKRIQEIHQSVKGFKRGEFIFIKIFVNIVCTLWSWRIFCFLAKPHIVLQHESNVLIISTSNHVHTTHKLDNIKPEHCSKFLTLCVKQPPSRVGKFFSPLYLTSHHL
jgi:hypothetical protein